MPLPAGGRRPRTPRAAGRGSPGTARVRGGWCHGSPAGTLREARQEVVAL